MRERDRLEYRRFLEETEVQQQAERERIEAPIRAMEVKLLDTHQKLIAVSRERLLGQTRDPELFVDDSVKTTRMTAQQADAFCTASFKTFIAEHPEYIVERNQGALQTLANMLEAYYAVNSIVIITPNMFEATFKRMADLNMLPELQPEPEPTTEPTSEPTSEPPQPSAPQTHIGRDFLTGLDREFSDRQVNRMSSLEFSRAFKVQKDLREIFRRDDQ